MYDLHCALAVFAAHREAYVTELRALPPEAWARAGRHEEQGRISVENHALHMATHDVQHLAQIARALRGTRAT